MKKRIISLILTAVICLTVLSGCITIPRISFSRIEYETEGNFLYLIHKVVDKEGNESEEVCIYGLSEEGKEQKIIVLPKTIAGRPVTKVGEGYWGRTFGEWESEKLEKVFFPYEVELADYLLTKCQNIKKVVKIPIKSTNHNFSIDNLGICLFAEKFTSYNYYSEGVWGEFYRKYDVFHFTMCDVSYMYNYEGAPNYGYYWVDDYDNETIEFIPDDPTREGFAFGGWYKEPECLNAWDFENDIVPIKEFCYIEGQSEDQYYRKQEVILYAKWING